MNYESIVFALDAEISRLQQARAVLASVNTSVVPKRGPGRPKSVVSSLPKPASKKRVLSEEARARIAAAQKKRWAAAKKASK